MADLITLADVPELAGTDASPRATIAVARLDDNLRDPRYGKFAITQADFDGWKANLANTFGGRVAIDFDHSSDLPGPARSTKAAAWITGLGQQGKLVTADVEFTPTGARSVRDGDYRYISPTFVDNYKDEHGDSHGRALLGAALTNRPVLRKGMPALSLSRDDFEGVATPPTKAERKAAKKARRLARDERARLLAEAESGTASSSDSRGRMADLKQLAQFLELPEDTDAATVLAKVHEIAPPAKADDKPETPAEKPETLTLSQDGTLTLSADQVATLVQGANAGLAAQKQLADTQFKVAWDKALSEGRAAPAQEDLMKAMFMKDADLAVKTLDSFVQIVPVKPTGSGDSNDVGTAPAGMEQDRFELHRKAQQRAKTLMAERQGLGEAEAYTLAAIEIEDAQAGVEGPVF